MHNSEDIVDDLLKARINGALNVSGVLHNCFFHSVALYFLGNKVSLPKDLFTIHDHDNEQVKQLKTFFPDLDSLDSFLKQYTAFKYPSVVWPYPNYLAEKTMILGIFLRGWFVKQLLANKENCKALFDNKLGEEARESDEHKTFVRLCTIYQEGIWTSDTESVNAFKDQAKGSPIYEANQKYFNSLNDLHLTEPARTESFQIYWEGEGYPNYCKYLNTVVSVSHNEVTAAVVLGQLGIPFGLYKRSFQTMVHPPAEAYTFPLFELALDVEKGHYYLLRTKETEAFLQEYENQLGIYAEEAKAFSQEYENQLISHADEDGRFVLNKDNMDNKITCSNKLSSFALFIEPTLPSAEEGPLFLLVQHIAEMKQALLAPPKSKSNVPPPEKQTQTPFCSSMQILGCFIAVLGIVAVALAAIALSGAAMGVVLALGLLLAVGGIGLFAAGRRNSQTESPDKGDDKDYSLN